MSELILKQFVVGPLENNNYLLIDESSKEAVLIDCTWKNDDLTEALNYHGAKLKYILLTHGHFDHILGVNDTKKEHNCRAFVHEDDKSTMDSVKEFAIKYGLPPAEFQNVDGYMKDNDIFKLGEHEIKVIHTPGHTKGGVCFLVNNRIFTGDTLFRESVGRTDLSGGDFSQIEASIKEKLFTLDENIEVFPGHGPSTTIGWEKEHNQFL